MNREDAISDDIRRCSCSVKISDTLASVFTCESLAPSLVLGKGIVSHAERRPRVS